MARTDIHTDAMLRHLGAAYYESLHGRASRTDVTRALDTVEEHLKEHGQRNAPTTARAGARRPHQPDGHHPAGRWTRRVRDVMTTSVVTVDRITPYKEIARLLAEHRISGLPVLMMGRHVAGVVSEADLLKVEEEHRRRARLGRGGSGRLHWPGRKPAHWGLTAGELMTAPAVTIHPDATIPGAARLMNAHHIRRLPVVDPDGKLLGIVSRRDLLSVFLRPDPEIMRDVGELVTDLLHEQPASVSASVHNGVVTLTGSPRTHEEADLVPVLIRLIWDVDGVVDVVNRLGEPAPDPAVTEEARQRTHQAAREQAPHGAAQQHSPNGTGQRQAPSGSTS
jgi:CBS domain-containing protein